MAYSAIRMFASPTGEVGTPVGAITPIKNNWAQPSIKFLDSPIFHPNVCPPPPRVLTAANGLLAPLLRKLDDGRPVDREHEGHPKVVVVTRVCFPTDVALLGVREPFQLLAKLAYVALG